MVKISLFGLAGTGTSSVGKVLAEKRGYIFYSSGNIFREMASERGLDLYKFGKLCEKEPQIDMELDKRVEKFGKTNDDFIIDSRLAWHFIPDSIKIKLSCTDEIRIKRVSERDEISFIDAKKKTVEREISEKTRYYNYYKIKDYTDDKHFDLVIDTSDISIEEVSRKIEVFVVKKLLK